MATGSERGDASPLPTAAEVGRDLPPPDVDERLTRRLDLARAAIGLVMAALAVVALATLLDGPVTIVDLLVAAGVAALAMALAVHHRATVAIADRRRSREASMTRILQGLSRSLSPGSVVEAIVAGLSAASGADHVVVARVRQPDGVVEVTLVAASPSVPPSRTVLRPEVAELWTDPAAARRDGAEAVPDADPSQAAADEIARRVRSAYGLTHALAAPLVADRRFLGALVLSKRTRDAWGDDDRRLLVWAAQEVAAAFTRTNALELAERGAHLDALTGLPNRRYFDEQLAILRPRRRAADQLGILMVDIDRFKGINDRFGHAVGDSVLRAVGDVIAATIRAEDTPARYGGEEFAVILRRASSEQAADVGERVRSAVATLPPERSGVDTPVTVSVGVAVAGEEEDVSEVVERADRALYLAKRRGRDRVETA